MNVLSEDMRMKGNISVVLSVESLGLDAVFRRTATFTSAPAASENHIFLSKAVQRWQRSCI